MTEPPTIDAAARWLVDLPDQPHPVIPRLRERFKLSTLDACEAVRRAAVLRDGRRPA